MLAGVALSAGRGAFPATRGPVDLPAYDTTRVEVVEFVNLFADAAAESVWAVNCGWPNVWERRLDVFALQLDDPCRQDLLDKQRFECHHAEYPFVIPEVEAAGEVDQDIVKVILTDRQPRHDRFLLDGHDDLMVELINLQRSRW